jgi:hypothetical protein
LFYTIGGKLKMSLVFTFFGSLWGIVTNLVVALFSGLLLLVIIAIALGIAAFVASIIKNNEKERFNKEEALKAQEEN